MISANILKEAYCNYTSLSQPFVVAHDASRLFKDVGYQLSNEEEDQMKQQVVKNNIITLDDFVKYCEENPLQPLEDEQIYEGLKNLQKLLSDEKIFPKTQTEYQKLISILQKVGSRCNKRKQQREFDITDAEMQFMQKYVIHGIDKNGEVNISKLAQKIKLQ